MKRENRKMLKSSRKLSFSTIEYGLKLTATIIPIACMIAFAIILPFYMRMFAGGSTEWFGNKRVGYRLSNFHDLELADIFCT
jgi:hypothetical protein